MTALRLGPARNPVGRRPLIAATLAAIAGLPAALAEPAAVPAADADQAGGVIVDRAVRPAALAPDPEDLAGPLPLMGAQASTMPATGQAPARADWTLLAAVTLAFGGLVGFRLLSRRRAHGLPPDVLEVLGGATLGGQHGLKVVRFGPRTLLVGVSPAGSRVLAEIDDPAVTERITAACAGGPSPIANGGRSSPRSRSRSDVTVVPGSPA